MKPTIFAGSAKLDIRLSSREVQVFPDSELHVELQESVRGDDVYLIQPTSPPAEKHLLELLLLADAARRAGAARLTAVIPYFGYARQDRRASGREAVGARLIANLLESGGLLERVVAVDVHTEAIEGFFSLPLEHLSAVPMLIESVRPHTSTDSVIVAPDMGTAELAERYAEPLELPVAVVHKARISGTEVSVGSVTGEVGGRKPILIDDMISTGGTQKAAIDALLEAGCEPEIKVATSHGLFAGSAEEDLRDAPVEQFIITDSVPPPEGLGLPLEVVSLASLLASAIDRLHNDRSLDDLIEHT